MLCCHSRGSAVSKSYHDSAQLVVPRSMPMAKRDIKLLELSVELEVYAISTSAGASTRGSMDSDDAGSRISRATHPWCRTVPRNGGSPATLPVSRMRCGSNPLGTVIEEPSGSLDAGSSSRY